MSPLAHLRRAEELLVQADGLDPYEEESSRVLLAAIGHALLSISAQLGTVTATGVRR